MNKIKKSLILIFVFFLFFLNSYHTLVKADLVPMPSITINLKNMKTDDYVIDLFVYSEGQIEGNINDENIDNILEKRRNNT